MNDDVPRWTLSRRKAEIGFSLFTLAVGGVILYGAYELDMGWTRSGPEAGYFPVRIAWLLIGASALVFLRSLFDRRPSEPLLTDRKATNLARFVLPLIALIVLAPWFGLYLAIALYLLAAIGIFGKVPWRTSIAVAVLAPSFLFVLFEFIFKVPLPKGPLGALFGIH
jgi:putative tricarboxylic transport membrane protein